MILQLKSSAPYLLALGILVFLHGCQASDPEPAQAPIPTPLPVSDAPVILISIDTLRADHLGCYGYSRPITPAIDQFRQDAVLFEQAIAQAPSTSPSHASILSSLWPEHHGAFSVRNTALPDAVLTLPEILADLGYQTASFNGGGQIAPEYGFDQGFDIYQVMGTTASTLETVRRAERWITSLTQTQLEPQTQLDPTQLDQTQLESREQSPFFLFLHTYHVHHPYTPELADLQELAPDYRGALPPKISKDLIVAINRGERELADGDLEYIVAAYDAEIRSMDAALGRLFAFLQQTDLYDRSIIVLTSDHGEEFGEHGQVGWHSHTLFDELLRVPLIIKLPDSRHAGLSVAAQVRSIDIAPTVLSLLGRPARSEFAGFDLRSLIADPSFDPDLPALSQQDTRVGVDHTSLRAGGWKLYPNRLFHMQQLGDGGDRAKYLKARLAWAMKQDRLYDLANDPVEQDDRMERRTRNRLQQLRADLKAERPVPAPVSTTPTAETLERLRALGYLD